MNILYLQPKEVGNARNIEFADQTGTYFLRISNYLNSHNDELAESINEEYLDLRCENVAKYNPKEASPFIRDFKRLIRDKNYDLDLVAISSYSSYEYLNTVEIASYLKTQINPKIIIVVGGVHPTLCPEDFQLNGIPPEFKKTYSFNRSPFNYLIKGEGEIPFYRLLKYLIMNGKRKVNHKRCEEREPEFIKDLNDLPLLNLSLFEDYREKYKGIGLQFDFARGCPFRCKFCINSNDKIQCYRAIRTKSVDKCVKELQIIKESKFKFKTIKISDPLFLPKRTMRTQFFNELDKCYGNGKRFPFKLIEINERMDICTKKDLENYKKYKITPHFGLESVSKLVLKRLGKVLGKNDEQINKGLDNYLKKFKQLVALINEIKLPHGFNYLLNPISENIQSYNEIEDFLFNPNDNLMEKYKINFRFAPYRLYVGTKLYRNAERKFGAKIYYKEWWKIFDNDQFFYSYLFKPSRYLDLPTALKKGHTLRKKIYKAQIQLGNPYYNNRTFQKYTNIMFKIIQLYKNLNLDK